MQNKELYAVVALFKCPIDPDMVVTPRDSAALITVSADAKDALETARESAEEHIFNAGGYVALYKVREGERFQCHKYHRIGDHVLDEKSPIVFIRMRNSEGWTEHWFDERFYRSHAQFHDPAPGSLEFQRRRDIEEYVERNPLGSKTYQKTTLEVIGLS